MAEFLPGQVALSLPPSWLFKFPPDTLPYTPAPVGNPDSVSSPVGIDASLFHAVLRPSVPITFAIGYVTLVKMANSLNRRRGNKPWSVSRTRAFSVFVILHNVALAVYSAVTCAAMARNVGVSVPSPFAAAGVPATLDSLCKLHGPRGLGDAVYYSNSTGTWMSKNRLIHLAASGLEPDATDVGRIWNEGLAFWGWWFYLSKFYEVLDTIIILAKGKRSSTLQTYHHAGAMMCMWAGIRYMGPPIWMFVLVNAGIHTIMYTYYTCAALHIRVPKAVKQLITTAQIMQFLVGITFAAAHFFVSYAVPVSVPVVVAEAAVSAAAGAASSVSSAAAAASSLANSASLSSLAASASASASAVAASAVTGDTVAWLKKFALRAANFEGPAQNVLHTDEGRVAANMVEAVVDKVPEVVYRDSYEMVHCLDTTGAAFAIWLNVVYLAPLTFLFARFFVKSYIWAQPAKTHRQRRMSDSAISAARKTSDAIERFGRSIEDTIGSFGEDTKRRAAVSPNEAKRKVKIMVAEAAGGRDAGEAIEDEEDAVPAVAAAENGAAKEAVEAVADSTPAQAGSNEVSDTTGRGDFLQTDTDMTNPLNRPDK